MTDTTAAETTTGTGGPGSDTATDSNGRIGALSVLVRRSALDPIRSGNGIVTVGLFALVGCLFAYAVADSTSAGFSDIVGVVAEVAPLLVVIRCADALAADRESGRLRGLLALPFSRRQVLVGTLLGRLGWFVVAALGAMVLALVVFVVFGGSVDPGPSLVAFVLLCLQLAVYVGIAIGVSAAVSTTTRAVVVAGALWLVTQLFWAELPVLVTFVRNGFDGATRPEWADTFVALGPLDAYQTLTTAFVQGDPVQSVLGGEPWSAFVVLLVWFVIPLLFGLRRFERASL